MSKQLQAAIIGCGAIAGGYDRDRPSDSILTHAKAYHAHPNFDLVACVEPDLEKRQQFMNAWNIPLGFSSVNDLDCQIDVVSLCTPTPSHADILDQLLLMPRSLVWAEKPITNNLARSRHIVSCYEKAGRALVVNYPRRWAVEIQKLKMFFEQGNYGRFQKATVFYSRGLLNNGSHALDILEFLLGSLIPVRCLSIGAEDIAGDPNLDVQLMTQNEMPVYMFGCTAEAFSIFEIQMLFEHGRISLLDSGFDIKIEAVIDSPRFVNYRSLSEIKHYSSGLDTALLNSLHNIHGHLTNAEPLLSTGRSALTVHELCVQLQSMPVHH